MCILFTVLERLFRWTGSLEAAALICVLKGLLREWQRHLNLVGVPELANSPQLQVTLETWHRRHMQPASTGRAPQRTDKPCESKWPEWPST